MPVAEVPPSTTAPPSFAPPSTLAAPDLTGIEAAVFRVEEVRGGSGRIETPVELMHYRDDRRRFLAVQIAATREDNLQMPHDEAALAGMILRGELVELAPLTEDYLLYEIGTAVNIDPLSHFDEASGKDVPLFGSFDEYEREDTLLALEAARRGRDAAKARERRELLASFYRSPTLRQQLFRERGAVSRLARDFGGISYDLSDPAARARFTARLLSFIRPQARDVLLQLARSYRLRFSRHLPVASLVRTARYQRRLARVNSNASTVDIAPHTTGEAFDITYKFMAPDEQNFLMEEVARLERAGRVEALRERRNSLHVYVFATGQRPSEQLVAQFLDDVGDEPRPRIAPRRSRAPAVRAGKLRGGVRARRRF